MLSSDAIDLYFHTVKRGQHKGEVRGVIVHWHCSRPEPGDEPQLMIIGMATMNGELIPFQYYTDYQTGEPMIAAMWPDNVSEGLPWAELEHSVALTVVELLSLPVRKEMRQ